MDQTSFPGEDIARAIYEECARHYEEPLASALTAYILSALIGEMENQCLVRQRHGNWAYTELWC